MLTMEKTGVYVPPEVMWTVSQVADRDRISKQAVSKRVRYLMNTQGLTVSKNASGNVIALNVVQYDLLRSRYGDQSQVRTRRDLAASPPAALTVDRKSYDEAVRQRAWLDMEKRRLEVAELRGQLIRADRYMEAVGACCAELCRIIDLLPQEADAVSVELGSDDVHRVRQVLKGIARRQRTDLAKAFEALAKEAPSHDEALPDPAHDDGGGEFGHGV